MVRIFLLDDEEINDIIFSSIVEEEEQIDYYYEGDGWKALQYLNKCEMEGNFPDIVFVDLNMPQMDGFTFIEYYERRFFSSFPNTKILVLSSSILLRDKERARQYPSVVDFINKPITWEKLKDIINDFELVD